MTAMETVPSEAIVPSVLVVEDNSSTRRMLCVALEAEGFSVMEAADGTSALRVARERAPDLVLQDLVLPDMHGIDVARQLNVEMQPAAPPIVAMTGLEDVADTEPFVCVVRKPIELDQLVVLVRSLTGRAVAPGHRTDRGLVLVVDDKPVQLRLATMQLEGSGFRVSAASGAAQALEMGRRDRPDVILSDILMPELDGFQLCEAIRRDPDLCSVPVVLISSAYLDAADRELAARVGASDLIPRSITTASLMSTLDAALATGARPAAGPEIVSAHSARLASQVVVQAESRETLERQLVVQTTMIAATARLAAAIAQRADVAQALREALYAVGDVSGIFHAAVCLPREDAGLDVPVAIGTRSGVNALEYAAEETLLRECAGESERPSTFGSTRPHRCLERWGFASVALVPLRCGGATLGVLVLGSTGPEFDNPDWLSFASLFGAHVAQAVGIEQILDRAITADRRRRQIMEQASDAIVVMRVDGAVVEANPQAARMIGESAGALQGRHFLSLLHPDEVPGGERRLARLLKAGALKEESIQLRRHDGTLLVVDAAATVIDAVGEKLILVVLRDVSERWHSQRALERSEARYRALVDTAATAVWTTDAEGQVVEPLPSLQAFTGQSFDAIKGSGWIQTVHADDQSSVMQSWRQAVTSGGPIELRYRLRRHDGVYRDVQVRGVPVRSGTGQLLEWMATVTDITETLSLERQIQRMQRLEAIGQLSGGIAHDFNNLLTSILGFTQCAADTLPSDHEVRSDLDEVLRAGHSAAALTRQLLAFARRQMWEFVAIDISALMTDLERLLTHVLGDDIQLQVSAAQAWMNGDRAQLEQLVMNLAINARDAMPDGGTLRIEVVPVRLPPGEVALVPAGEWVRLTVADTGCGMSDDVRAQAFEPFFTTKERNHGTGLGLATVYGIVKQAEGFIFLDSAEGRGTTFTIYFPLCAPPALRTPTSQGAAPAADRGQEVVLLVDDNASVRRFTGGVLRRYGYTVLDTDSPRAAIALVEAYQGPIDLLVSDVVMPEMSGAEMARAVEAVRPGLRTLFISGYTDCTSGQRALPDDATFLHKPFLPQALAQKVREALDAGATRSGGETARA